MSQLANELMKDEGVCRRAEIIFGRKLSQNLKVDFFFLLTDPV